MAASSRYEGFSADELFRLSDNRVPLGSEHAFRGLIKPFESIFPNSRVLNPERVASEFIKAAKTRMPEHPPDWEMKKDWVEWIFWEVRLRLGLATRFNMFREVATRIQPGPSDRRLILFLREFREIEYNGEAGIHLATRIEEDILLRDRIEKMFLEYPVLWIANPRDDLSRSFYNEIYQQKANDNSIPYVASENWLRCVKLMSEAADLIVMSNTKSSGGVGQEIALLKESGLLEKTFFANPDRVDLKAERLKGIDDLTPASLQDATGGKHEKVLELPPLRHWLGAESMEYARHYLEALDICAGESKGLGKAVSYDIFAALFLALSALLILRAELKAAASFQETLATIMERNPDSFGYYDVYAIDALLESAEWYRNNADDYAITHALQFIKKPHDHAVA